MHAVSICNIFSSISHGRNGRVERSMSFAAQNSQVHCLIVPSVSISCQLSTHKRCTTLTSLSLVEKTRSCAGNEVIEFTKQRPTSEDVTILHHEVRVQRPYPLIIVTQYLISSLCTFSYTQLSSPRTLLHCHS